MSGQDFTFLCCHCGNGCNPISTLEPSDGECYLCGNVGLLSAVTIESARERMLELLMEEFKSIPNDGIRNRAWAGEKSDMPIFDRATARIIGVGPPLPKDWSK